MLVSLQFTQKTNSWTSFKLMSYKNCKRKNCNGRLILGVVFDYLSYTAICETLCKYCMHVLLRGCWIDQYPNKPIIKSWLTAGMRCINLGKLADPPAQPCSSCIHLHCVVFSSTFRVGDYVSSLLSHCLHSSYK